MNYFIVTDLHLFHNKITQEDFDSRPEDYVARIIKNLKVGKSEDVLIDLGDVSFYKDKEAQELIKANWAGKRILVRGNHDKKSDEWYLQYYDFVCESFTMNRFGETLLFSHKPVEFLPDGVTVNIHGHLHQKKTEERGQITRMHYGVYMEPNFAPKSLRHICEQIQRERKATLDASRADVARQYEPLPMDAQRQRLLAKLRKS